MAKAETCEVCGRSVTIVTDREEYVDGLQGYEEEAGVVLCEGNRFGTPGVCVTTDKDGDSIEVMADSDGNTIEA